jgi:hypothetical protein
MGPDPKAALNAEELVEALPNDLLGDLAATFRKGIFDIKADTYVERGEGVPFIRITDIKTGMIRKHSTAWIDDAAHSREAKTALKLGDLVLSKTAYPAAAIVNVPDCNVSQDTIAVRLSTDGKRHYRTGYIAAYLNSVHGLALMGRRFQVNVQQHLSLEDGKSIRIPRLSVPFQDRIHNLVLRVDRQQVAVTNAMLEGEDALLVALGLANWTPPQPLAYTACSSAVFASGRFDAQYFRPLFAEVADRLEATGRAVELGKILSVNLRGRQPQYDDVGLPVINSKHVRKHRVVLEDNRTATEKGSPVVIETGDVLLNGTGVGTIGRAAPYLHQTRALPDNHVTGLRITFFDLRKHSGFEICLEMVDGVLRQVMEFRIAPRFLRDSYIGSKSLVIYIALCTERRENILRQQLLVVRIQEHLKRGRSAFRSPQM